jgi:hypothetical protein
MKLPHIGLALAAAFLSAGTLQANEINPGRQAASEPQAPSSTTIKIVPLNRAAPRAGNSTQIIEVPVPVSGTGSAAPLDSAPIVTAPVVTAPAGTAPADALPVPVAPADGTGTDVPAAGPVIDLPTGAQPGASGSGNTSGEHEDPKTDGLNPGIHVEQPQDNPLPDAPAVEVPNVEIPTAAVPQNGTPDAAAPQDGTKAPAADGKDPAAADAPLLNLPNGEPPQGTNTGDKTVIVPVAPAAAAPASGKAPLVIIPTIGEILSEVTPPNKKEGEELVIPKDATTLDFLEGVWKCKMGDLRRVHDDAPISAEFSFNKNGKGNIRFLFEDKTESRGTVQAKLTKGKLRIRTSNILGNAGKYHKQQFDCQQAEGKPSAVCSGHNVEGTPVHYWDDVVFVRVQ